MKKILLAGMTACIPHFALAEVISLECNDPNSRNNSLELSIDLSASTASTNRTEFNDVRFDDDMILVNMAASEADVEFALFSLNRETGEFTFMIVERDLTLELISGHCFAPF